jgi:hypothetical protein
VRFKLTATDRPRDSTAPKIRLNVGGTPRDGGDDEESFKRYVAGISQQIAARSNRPLVEVGLSPAPVPKVERDERKPYRPLAWMPVVLAAAVAAGGLYLFSSDGTAPRAARTAMAWAPPPPTAAPPVDLESTRVPQSSAVERAAPPPPPAPAMEPVAATPPAAPAAAPASADEVREAQTRLRSLGLNPGPVDGVAGPATVAAVRRYQQTKSQEPSGIIDRDLLARLRQEPDRTARAPKTAARPTR